MKRALEIPLLAMSMFLFAALLCSAQPAPIKTERQAIESLDIVLVLDNSGSMKKNDPDFLTRDVVTSFVDSLASKARLGMVIFDKDARLTEPLTDLSDFHAKSGFLASLDQVNYRGLLTNSPAGVERAIYELKTHGGKTASKVIIFLTDGIVDTGDKNQDIEKTRWLQNDLSLESKQANIRIFGIAFTDQADYRLIQTVALKTDGAYFRVFNAEDIGGVFNKIIDLINKPPPESEKKPVEAPPPARVVVIQQPSPVSVPQQDPVPAPQSSGDSSRSTAFVILFAVLLCVAVLLFLFWKKSKAFRGRPDAEISMPKAKLVDIGAIVSNEPVSLNKQMIKIGRDANNDVVIEKKTISSLHATIEYKDDHFYLEDQRSTNNTRLNEQKLDPHKPIRLKSGDRIKFDLYEFKFLLPDQAPAGGTVLAGSRSSGTVLRPPAPAESTPVQEQDQSQQSQEVPDASTEEKSDAQETPPEGEPVQVESSENLKDPPKTRLKAVMCPLHPWERATEMCDICKSGFCQNCMSDSGDQYVCSECSEKINATLKDGA